MKTAGLLIPDLDKLFEATLNLINKDGEEIKFDDYSEEDMSLFYEAFDNKQIQYFHKEVEDKFQSFIIANFNSQTIILEKFQDCFRQFFVYNDLSNRLFDNLLDRLELFEDTLNNKIVIALYGELLRLSDQIFQMIINGYSDGAIRLWRTLHERSAVLLLLIKEFNNSEIFTMFIDHDQRNQIKKVRSYDDKHKILKFPKANDSVLSDLEALKKKYDGLYGKEFLKHDYSWANKTLNKKQTNFADIEKFVNLDKLRPFYIWSNSYIHSSFSSLKDYIQYDNIINIRKITQQNLEGKFFTDPLQLCLMSIHEVNLKILEMYCVDYECDINIKLLKKVFENMKDFLIELEKKDD